ncbi:hypothetical protein KAR91_18540 [Candidatus Pacearchaeota archaeon]|nr:hypothetical protein [Candidatus Pacearchaeota archaeon]
MSSTPAYHLEYVTYSIYDSIGHFGEIEVGRNASGIIVAIKNGDSPNNITFLQSLSDNETTHDFFRYGTITYGSNIINSYPAQIYGYGQSVNYVPHVIFDYGYMIYYDTNDDLRVLDVTDPLNIRSLSTTASITNFALDVEGDYAYGGSYSDGWKIFDISDYDSPGVVYVNYSPPNDFIWGIEADGDYLYVMNNQLENIEIWNISNKTSPTMISTYDTGTHHVVSLRYSNDYLYYINCSTDALGINNDLNLVIINVSDRSNPIFVSTTRIENDTDMVPAIYFGGIYIEELRDLAYLSCPTGVKIYNISDKNSPSLNSVVYNITEGTTVSPARIDVESETLYVSCRNNGIRIFNVSNSSAPISIRNITEITAVDWVKKDADKDLLYCNSGGTMYLIGLAVENVTAHLIPYFYFDEYVDEKYTVTMWADPDERYGQIDNSSNLTFSACDWSLNYTVLNDWQRSIDSVYYNIDIELLSSSRNKTIALLTDVYFVRNDENVFVSANANKLFTALYVDNVTIGFSYELNNPNAYGIFARVAYNVTLFDEFIGTYYFNDSNFINITYSSTFLWDGSITLDLVDAIGMNYPAYLQFNSHVIYELNASNHTDDWNWTYIYTYEWPNDKHYFNNRILELDYTSSYYEGWDMDNSNYVNNYFLWDSYTPNMGLGYYDGDPEYSDTSSYQRIEDGWPHAYTEYTFEYRYVDVWAYFSFEYNITPINLHSFEDIVVDMEGIQLDFFGNPSNIHFEVYLYDANETRYIKWEDPESYENFGPRREEWTLSRSNYDEFTFSGAELITHVEVNIRFSTEVRYSAVSETFFAKWASRATVYDLKVHALERFGFPEELDTFESDVYWERPGSIVNLSHGDIYRVVVQTNNITNITFSNNYTSDLQFQSSDYWYYNITFNIESIVPTIDYNISSTDLGIITVGNQIFSEVYLWSNTKAWIEYSINITGDYAENWTRSNIAGQTNESLRVYNPNFVNIMDIVLHFYTDDPNTPYFNLSVTIRVEPAYTNYIDFGETAQAYRQLQIYNTYGEDDFHCEIGFQGVYENSYSLQSDLSTFRIDINTEAELTFETQHKHTELTLTMRSSGTTSDIYYILNDGSPVAIYGLNTTWTNITLELLCEDIDGNFLSSNTIRFDIETGADWVDFELTSQTSENYSTRFKQINWYTSTQNLRHDLLSRDIWADDSNFEIVAGDYHLSQIYFVFTGVRYLVDNITGNITLNLYDPYKAAFRMQLRVPFIIYPAYGDYIFITSNIDELFVIFYYGESNSFEITFTNVGTINDTIASMNTSISWISTINFLKDLNINEPVNISFTAADIDQNLVGDSVTFELNLVTGHNVRYSGSMIIYIDVRSKYTLVQPIDKIREIERKAGEIKTISFTIRNDGEGTGYYDVYVVDLFTEDEEHNYLVYTGFSFELAPDEEYTIELEISGDFVTDNETWYVELYQDGVLIDTYTVIVKTNPPDEPGSWVWMFALWCVAAVAFVLAMIARRKINRRNDIDQATMVVNEDYNLKKEEKGATERKPITKFQTKIMGRNAILITIAFSVLALVGIPIYLWYTNAYEAPWKIGSIIKNKLW